MIRGGLARQPTVEKKGLGCPEFVRIVCPNQLVAAGLAGALEEAGVLHGPEPPEEDIPHCVVLYANDAEGFPENMERILEARPDATILVFSLRNDLPLARAALRAGASGFIHAGMWPTQIARALSVASSGEIAAPRELIEFMLEDRDHPANLDGLSIRQRESLEFAVKGLSNVQIAELLFLSESTVKQHLRAAYKILGVRNRIEAARLMHRAASAGDV